MSKTIAILPAYNEATRIGPVIDMVKHYVDSVVVVDDGSTDATADIAKRAGAIVVGHIENCGAGAATMTGIEAARGLGATAVITLDADGQHNAEDIIKMLQPIKEERADIVFANRFGGGNKIPFIRRIFNGIGNIVTLFATGKWMADSQCGFKALGPRAIEEIELKMNGFEFCTEIVREAAQYRWRIAEVPIRVLYSEYTLAKGQSFANGIKTAFKIILRSFLR